MFPIVLEAGSVQAALDELLADEKSKLNALTFGTNYKKDGADNLQRTGCVQQPVHIDSGKDALLKLEQAMTHLIDGYVQTDDLPDTMRAPRKTFGSKAWSDRALRVVFS